MTKSTAEAAQLCPASGLAASRHPETHAGLKVTRPRCKLLRSGLRRSAGLVSRINLIVSIGSPPLTLSFSADLPASPLQYQCGPVDFPCSPRLLKKGPASRPCHDRPAVRPRPQSSASPRPPAAQKPQGKKKKEKKKEGKQTPPRTLPSPTPAHLPPLQVSGDGSRGMGGGVRFGTRY